VTVHIVPSLRRRLLQRTLLGVGCLCGAQFVPAALPSLVIENLSAPFGEMAMTNSIEDSQIEEQVAVLGFTSGRSASLQAPPFRRTRLISSATQIARIIGGAEPRRRTMDRFVVISGCSGGGKSTLIAEFCRRGYGVVDEPGRRIVNEELANGGTALPWVDGIAFARRAIATSLADRSAAGSLDGCLIDAAAALQHLTGEPVLAALGRVHRRHGLDAAMAEYLRLLETYPSLGYEVSILPKVGVPERADFILRKLTA
jgi:predicted ATPase